MSKNKLPFLSDTTSPLWSAGLVLFGVVLLFYPLPIGMKLVAAASIIIGFALSGGVLQRLFGNQHIPDHTILHIAQSNRGILTTALLALEAKISIETAHTILERCRHSSLCTADVDNKGRVVYYFADFTENKEERSPLQS